MTFNNGDAQYPEIIIPSNIGKYTIIAQIGSGGFSKVALGIDPKSQKKVAIKIYSRLYITENNMISFLEHEMRLHSRFDHPNIVKVLDVIYEPEYIMIVMDYYKNGDLINVLTNGTHFTFNEKLSAIHQIVDAVNYLHQRGIWIRDIKPENILFDDNYRPMLIDFGLAKENGMASKTLCGTFLYIAPEVISSPKYNAIQADIWSLAVTIHIFCTKKFPWEENSDAHIINQMASKKLEIDNQTTGFIKQILEQCLVFDPEKRPTAQDILSLFDYYQHKRLIHPKSDDLILKSKRQPLPRINTKKAHISKDISESNFLRRGERIRRFPSKLYKICL
ncbi:CAMK family protein kinase [Trichomonas vaginalis G3]|uniref:CAMK family protein kinase n=1 Tax=Trichomonas vaginalis (strain ATCC PRA-98 / G3) TaxID=412133 RepID=A2EY06_TRIV3|nr:protein serine/threonine kinase protein [Trichomonas vaginalis G3]EAY02474.1 CAMK family protein kinase [Trichomonas vaginalis G3]KAI5511209.1 protein serine/threonine kinase protein [Trichomonas vaginalis G3]|eukprot:XP_001314713.1 CAMK family protein kinase [Trichomonas vaginalis G3]